ncbi:hypothetical protein [Stenotrophomonas indicatrix]|uniref:hypothetical protein n=1 Tax=Stenotrophomonas indicatrix TaxID=2045451 RepID=UPI001AA0B45D|nr:hypothetical protein [Stenotrophomonas indicatrix]MBO1748941.1 hypothetical protein [Stenotrophomonas indicatrix]
MTTDKTLADAKPGGCVQLGKIHVRESLLRHLVRELNHARRGFDSAVRADYVHRCLLSVLDASDGQQPAAQPSPGSQGDVPECAKRAMYDEVWNALQAAGFGDELASSIAAMAARQPSTGGQGNVDMHALAASIGEVAHRLSTYMPHLSEWADRARDCKKAAEVLSALAARQPVCPDARDIIAEFVQCADAGRQPAKLIAQAKDYLAARQPVGEAIGEIVYSGEGGLQIELYDGKPLAPMKLYAAPTAQQPAQVYLDGLDRALGEAIDQRDRYHEVADDLAGHIAAITSVDIGEHSSANCPWQNAIEAAEEYKPAQAVDLGQFRDVVADWRDRCCRAADKDTILNMAKADRLLALIDGKAVGK